MGEAVKVDIIGLFADTIVQIGRFVLRHIGSEQDSHPGRILLSWKRNGVCVETLEYGKETSKLYPSLVDKGWNGHNRVFKYKIPTGLKHDKLIKSLNDIEFDLKSEVLFKRLENDKKAHFSLTILSGKLLDLINYTNEAEKIPTKKGLWVPVGWSRRGLEQLDLASSNSPHLMIGGAAGGGKSILGRLIMACLHMRYTRDECRLWLGDLKHGNGTALLGRDPLLVDRTITSVDDVGKMMDDLSLIIGERYELFKKYECDDISAFNEEYPNKMIPRIVVYFDEYTKMEGKELRNVRDKVTKVTGESRGAGVHFIISCHRPTANLVSGTMKNNIPAVVAFRCNPVSARVLLGEDEWESSMMIDKDVEGRALFKFKDEVLIQVPFINNKMIKDIMASYQKPQSTQAGPDKVNKATKEPDELGKNNNTRKAANAESKSTEVIDIKAIEPHRTIAGIVKVKKE
jgi:hypothetical protein